MLFSCVLGYLKSQIGFMKCHKTRKVAASPRTEVNGYSLHITLKWAMFPKFPTPSVEKRPCLWLIPFLHLLPLSTAAIFIRAQFFILCCMITFLPSSLLPAGEGSTETVVKAGLAVMTTYEPDFSGPRGKHTKGSRLHL